MQETFGFLTARTYVIAVLRMTLLLLVLLLLRFVMKTLVSKMLYSSYPNKCGAPNKRGDGKISTNIGMKNIQKGYFTIFFGQMRLKDTRLVHFIIIFV